METYEEEMRFRYLHNLKEMCKNLDNQNSLDLKNSFYNPVTWNNKKGCDITFFRGLFRENKNADDWLMTIIFRKGYERTESVFNYSAPTEYNVRRLKRLIDATM